MRTVVGDWLIGWLVVKCWSQVITLVKLAVKVCKVLGLDGQPAKERMCEFDQVKCWALGHLRKCAWDEERRSQWSFCSAPECACEMSFWCFTLPFSPSLSLSRSLALTLSLSLSLSLFLSSLRRSKRELPPASKAMPKVQELLSRRDSGQCGLGKERCTFFLATFFFLLHSNPFTLLWLFFTWSLQMSTPSEIFHWIFIPLHHSHCTWPLQPSRKLSAMFRAMEKMHCMSRWMSNNKNKKIPPIFI